MWLHCWDSTGGTLTGRVSTERIISFSAHADNDYGGDYVVSALTVDSGSYRLTANATLSSQADALAKLDSLLIDGS